MPGAHKWLMEPAHPTSELTGDPRAYRWFVKTMFRRLESNPPDSSRSPQGEAGGKTRLYLRRLAPGPRGPSTDETLEPFGAKKTAKRAESRMLRASCPTSWTRMMARKEALPHRCRCWHAQALTMTTHQGSDISHGPLFPLTSLRRPN